MNRRAVMFQYFDADREHQRLAGAASWAAFSARWRARQGLPLLHPMDVQYLTPQDFCDGCGQPLPPTVQRRLFRRMGETILRRMRPGPCLRCVPMGCRWHLVALTHPISATGWMGQWAMTMTMAMSPGLMRCRENCLCKRGVCGVK